jgi:hypothetical protein
MNYDIPFVLSEGLQRVVFPTTGVPAAAVLLSFEESLVAQNRLSFGNVLQNTQRNMQILNAPKLHLLRFCGVARLQKRPSRKCCIKRRSAQLSEKMKAGGSVA